MTNNRNTLVRLNSQVEFAKDITATTRVSEKYVPELDATVQVNNIAWLFRIDCRRLLDNAKNGACSLFSLRNTWHLTNTYTAADSSDEHNIASSEHTLWVQAESLDEDCCNVKYESDENKSYRSRVPEKQTTNVSAFNVGKVGNNKKFWVSIKNKLQVFLSEGDHSSVVHDNVVEQSISLLVWVIDRFLVELKFADSEST